MGSSTLSDDALWARCFADHVGASQWRQRYHAAGPDVAQARRNNPSQIPRNHLVDAALTAATANDLRLFEQLLLEIQSPYTQSADWDRHGPADPEFERRFKTYCGT